MKIAYLGYDFFFGCLEAIAASGHEIIFIGTNNCDNEKYNFNVRTTAFASEHNTPFKSGRLTAVDIRSLEGRGCDLIITAAYRFRVPIESASSLKGINVHPTLLPKGRGVWPLPHIILREMEESGVTLHMLNSEFDAGDIVLQGRFGVSALENLESLSCKVQMEAQTLMATFCERPMEHIEQARPQSEFGVPEIWSNPTLDDRTLDWNKPVLELDRIARAFGKFKSCAKFDEIEWIVDDITGWEVPHDLKPGTVAHRSSCEVVVAVADGFVCLRHFEVDPE